MVAPLRAPSKRTESRRVSVRDARRPRLRVVPDARRRWPAVVAGFLVALVIGAMFGAAVFHTQLADRQLRIDRLDSAVAEARERFDELRHERAMLRSPERVSNEAIRLGMVPGETSRFIAVDPADLARQIAAAGPIGDDPLVLHAQIEPLDQVRDVKAVTAGDP